MALAVAWGPSGQFVVIYHPHVVHETRVSLSASTHPLRARDYELLQGGGARGNRYSKYDGHCTGSVQMCSLGFHSANDRDRYSRGPRLVVRGTVAQRSIPTDFYFCSAD